MRPWQHHQGWWNGLFERVLASFTNQWFHVDSVKVFQHRFFNIEELIDLFTPSPESKQHKANRINEIHNMLCPLKGCDKLFIEPKNCAFFTSSDRCIMPLVTIPFHVFHRSRKKHRRNGSDRSLYITTLSPSKPTISEILVILRGAIRSLFAELSPLARSFLKIASSSWFKFAIIT